MRLVLLLTAGLALACTGHAGEDGSEEKKVHEFTNRLSKESSPYLLQHAKNPVDWYPWGAEAFARAKEEDRPVFLSIGYATCHWCHVMERESFENREIAAFLNEHFVPVKVDREERPDVDNIYMAAVQAMTGSGGWPLSVFLTPDGKPFWGGTYFPPEDRFGRPGFLSVLSAIADAWENRRPDLLSTGEKLTDHVRDMAKVGAKAPLTAETLSRGYDQYSGSFDAEYGGFGPAPKFPRAHSLSFLLRRFSRSGEARALEMVEKTLSMMWRGGVYDHLGGGFHRYSTDREWLVPHFEKMLYDQALAARAYLEAYQVTGGELYADVARDVFRYVLRDMTDERGGFYSAEDADSEGVEGKFYVWTTAELAAVLGEEDARVFAEAYGAVADGNWAEEASGEEMRSNILHLPAVPDAELRAKLAPMREKLLAVREKRVHPLKDDKILTDWNGLMISTLAYAGRVLGEERYTAAARRAADFVLTAMVEDGRLLHRYRDGKASIKAFLDDYAFLVAGLLELYEATFEERWLSEARRLAGRMVELFYDEEAGGFFFSGDDGEALVSPTKELYDGAIPSGNSVAMLALQRLARIVMDEGLEERARASLSAFSGFIDRHPMGFPCALMALDFAVGPTREIVVAGTPGEAGAEALVREVQGRFLPRTVVSFHPEGEAGAAVRKLVPFLEGKLPVDGKAAAYVCQDYACREPVTDPAALRKLLDTD